MFGEAAVFEDGRRTASIVTCSKVTLLEIEQREFHKFLYNYSVKTQPILLFLVNQLVDKLHDSNNEQVQIRNQLYAAQNLRGASE